MGCGNNEGMTPREVERGFFATRLELAWRRRLSLPPPWVKIFGCALYRRVDVSRCFLARPDADDSSGRGRHADA